MSAHGLRLQPSRLKVSLALPSKPATPTPGSLAAAGTPDSNPKGTIDSSLSLTMAMHGRPPGPTHDCWVTCPADTGFSHDLCCHPGQAPSSLRWRPPPAPPPTRLLPPAHAAHLADVMGDKRPPPRRRCAYETRSIRDTHV